MLYVNRHGQSLEMGQVQSVSLLSQGVGWEVRGFFQRPDGGVYEQKIETFEKESEARLFASFLNRWQYQGASIVCFHQDPQLQQQMQQNPGFSDECNLTVVFENEKELIMIVIFQGMLSFQKVALHAFQEEHSGEGEAHA
ncbi:MAG TPA: hypothetical protein P5560_04710 [Thermotogota bacterium]|mgnify:CR=1 FL=1|nr:hypothetical protein [Thermotogota bacterium]HRW92236.1 hypothetical protein [Thermotogota bacterium]